MIEVTARVGVTRCIRGESDVAALLRRADVALYEAKRRGRNSYHSDGHDTSTTGAGVVSALDSMFAPL